MEHELKKLSQMIAKRVYPETEKEKKCIEEFGKMIIKRGHLSKQIIQLCNESKAKEIILDTAKKHDAANSGEVES